MHIGYVRVSTEDQDTRLQFDSLTDAGCERIYQEAASGSNREPPNWGNVWTYYGVATR